MGAAVIMGRSTFDSIPSRFRPLKGRINIVVSRTPSLSSENLIFVTSYEKALEKVDELQIQEAFAIGGESCYQFFLSLKHIDRVKTIHLTTVFEIYDCDRFFPLIPEGYFCRPSEPVVYKEKDLEFSMTVLFTCEKK